MSSSDAAPVAFSAHIDALRAAATRLVEAAIGPAPYEHSRVRSSVKMLADGILAESREIAGDKFKIIVSVAVVQTGDGAGLASHSAVYWDPSQDGSVSISVPTEHLTTIVTIFGLALS